MFTPNPCNLQICNLMWQKGFCGCDLFKELEMERLSCIIWVASVQSQVFIRGSRSFRVAEEAAMMETRGEIV